MICFIDELPYQGAEEELIHQDGRLPPDAGKYKNFGPPPPPPLSKEGGGDFNFLKIEKRIKKKLGCNSKSHKKFPSPT